MTLGRRQSGNGLPDLLVAVPWWYPGAWGPPAFTVSLASFFIAAFAAAWLFRNELVRAMFRFPFDSLWVAAPATALAGVVVWRASLRPGKYLPRIWALALAVFCGSVTLWTLYVRITSQSDTPRLHALTAIGALAGITLAPRLFHVHPFSRWVRHAATAALAFVILFCFPLVVLSEKVVVAKERQLLDTKIAALEKAAKDIFSIVHAAPVKPSPFSLEQIPRQKLEDVNFSKFLPDEADWKALSLLQRQAPDQHGEDRMRAAMSLLLEGLIDGATNPDAPRLSQAQVYADGVSENNDTRWRENRRFLNDASAAALYYHQLGTMFREFEGAGKASPFRDDYQPRLAELGKSVEERSATTGELWIPAVFMGHGEPADLQNLVSSHVGDSSYALGDLGRWKTLSWSDAKSLLNKPGCLSEAQSLQRYETIQVPDPDHPGETRDERVLRHYDRIECYAYRPGRDGNSAEILAELHLTYRQEWSSVPSSATPHAVTLLFDVPPKAGRYKDNLMQALADQAKEKCRVTPQNRFGVTTVQGFSVSSKFETFTAIPSEIRRKADVVTIEVRVY